jgi:hypothetical protein
MARRVCGMLALIFVVMITPACSDKSVDNIPAGATKSALLIYGKSVSAP